MYTKLLQTCCNLVVMDATEFNSEHRTQNNRFCFKHTHFIIRGDPTLNCISLQVANIIVTVYICTAYLHYLVHCRDETILQYINTLQYSLLKYNTICLKKISIYYTQQYIVIYCNVCCLQSCKH